MGRSSSKKKQRNRKKEEARGGISDVLKLDDEHRVLSTEFDDERDDESLSKRDAVYAGLNPAKDGIVSRKEKEKMGMKEDIHQTGKGYAFEGLKGRMDVVAGMEEEQMRRNAGSETRGFMNPMAVAARVLQRPETRSAAAARVRVMHEMRNEGLKRSGGDAAEGRRIEGAEGVRDAAAEGLGAEGLREQKDWEQHLRDAAAAKAEGLREDAADRVSHELRQEGLKEIGGGDGAAAVREQQKREAAARAETGLRGARVLMRNKKEQQQMKSSNAKSSNVEEREGAAADASDAKSSNSKVASTTLLLENSVVSAGQEGVAAMRMEQETRAATGLLRAETEGYMKPSLDARKEVNLGSKQRNESVKNGQAREVNKGENVGDVVRCCAVEETEGTEWVKRADPEELFAKLGGFLRDLQSLNSI